MIEHDEYNFNERLRRLFNFFTISKYDFDSRKHETKTFFINKII